MLTTLFNYVILTYYDYFDVISRTYRYILKPMSGLVSAYKGRPTGTAFFIYRTKGELK